MGLRLNRKIPMSAPRMRRERLRNSRVENTVWTACAVLCSAMLALYLIECLPYLSFRYDIDPSDGDVLNQSVRLLHGFPLYGDWSKGEIFGNYTPGYYYYLALASSVGFDPVVAGRWSNIAFMILSFALAAYLTVRTARFSSYAPVFALLTMSILFGRAHPVLRNNLDASVYIWAVMLRADALYLVIALAACGLAVVNARPAFVGVIAALCPVVKQTGIVVPAGLLAYYVIHDRGAVRSFFIGGVATGALVTIPLELLNGGTFVKSTFIMPNRVFATETNWPHFWETVDRYYRSWESVAIAASAVLAAYYSIREKLETRPLVWVAAIDAVLFLRTGQNDAGGSSYLWLHWALLAILAGVGVACLIDGPQSPIRGWRMRVSDGGRTMATAALIVCGTLAATLPVRETLANAQRDRLAYEQLTVTGAQHETLVRRLMAQHPGQWYAERFASPLVRSGHMLDAEACTLQHACHTAGIVDNKRLAWEFAVGKYHFVQRSFIADIPAISKVMNACFHVVAKSETPDRGTLRAIDILEYTGPSGSCSLAAELTP
jgi:hypothetical protein